MNNNNNLKHIDFLIVDFICLILSIVIVASSRKILPLSDAYRALLAFEVLIFFVIVYFYNPYHDILRRKPTTIINYNIWFVLMQFGFTTIILFALKFGASVSRIYVFSQYIIYFILSSLSKLLWKKHLVSAASSAITSGRKTMLIITDKKRVKELIKQVNTSNYGFYRIIGLCIIDDNQKNKKYSGIKVVCNKDELLSYVCRSWVDEVYIDLSYRSIPEDLLEGLSKAGITTHIKMFKMEAFMGKQQSTQRLFNEPVFTSTVKERTNKQKFMKKLTDILGGLVGSLLTLLLAIIIGPIIKIKSPNGPIFYKQERIGLNGKKFMMYKFRSMVPNADELKKDLLSKNRIKDGMMFKVKDDPRIIPGIGEFIRKTSLDEFPQFFNVLRGEMSLVGTRPPTVDEWEKYKLEHRIRMSIKPGITGLWQVSGRSTITDFNKVIDLDSEYITNWSLGLDLEIIIKTIGTLFKKRKEGEAL